MPSSETITRYTLDAESNVIAMTDPNGAQSSSIYDRVDRLSRYTHRLQGVTEYEYNTRDRIIRVVAPNEVVTEYDYDVLARVTEERSPDRGPLRYEYDLADNVIAIREGRGIVMRLFTNGSATLVQDGRCRIASAWWLKMGFHVQCGVLIP